MSSFEVPLKTRSLVLVGEYLGKVATITDATNNDLRSVFLLLTVYQQMFKN